MMALVLLFGIAAAFGVGCLIWRYLRNQNAVRQPNAPARRREDARDWQRRFGAASLLATNFLQPTQNEILETLYVLDHLTPGWEAKEAGLAERHFLNELALNFPTLRKPDCAFPLPFAETPTASTQLRGAGALAPEPAQKEEEVALKRETYRATRAQINALEQIVSGSADREGVSANGVPFNSSAAAPGFLARNRWPGVFAGAALLLVAALGVVCFFPKAVGLESAARRFGYLFARPSVVMPTAAIEPSLALPTAAPSVAVASPTPAPAHAAAILTEATPAPPSPSMAAREKAALDQQIAASKQRAISKYPALAVEGSEINLRFVFRYKNLIQQNSPRLLEPTWPEQLVEECAVAAGVTPKRNAFTQVLGTQH